MTFNHLKTNSTKLARYRLKILKVIEFCDFQSLMQHPFTFFLLRLVCRVITDCLSWIRKIKTYFLEPEVSRTILFVEDIIKQEGGYKSSSSLSIL